MLHSIVESSAKRVQVVRSLKRCVESFSRDRGRRGNIKNKQTFAQHSMGMKETLLLISTDATIRQTDDSSFPVALNHGLSNWANNNVFASTK